MYPWEFGEKLLRKQLNQVHLEWERRPFFLWKAGGSPHLNCCTPSPLVTYMLGTKTRVMTTREGGAHLAQLRVAQEYPKKTLENVLWSDHSSEYLINLINIWQIFHKYLFFHGKMLELLQLAKEVTFTQLFAVDLSVEEWETSSCTF